MTIKEIVDAGIKLKSELGDEVRAKVEELKDIEVAAYEKTKKKKDPEIKREDIKVRLPDEILHQLVKSHIAQPACMNKGFILDGYPRKWSDAEAVFLDPIPGYEAPEDATADESDFPGLQISQKIVP